MKRIALVAVATALVAAGALALGGCPPKPQSEQLPPPGIAGGGSKDAPLALPGAGVPVPDPSGTATPQTQLPPGHPAIPGATVASADPAGGGADHPGLPPGHPGVGAAMPSMGGGADDAAATLTGNVLETMDVPEYTYMRVKTASDPAGTWVAVTKTPVAVGDVVTVNQSLVMTDFFSKGLNRSFPKLVMGSLVGAPKKP